MLSQEQIRELGEYLKNKGLTSQKIRSEMLDHLCCDIEQLMEQGLSYDQATEQLFSEIPKNQFKRIQIETMETINKRIKTTKILTYATFVILVVATLFKVMHLPGAGILLFSSFIGLSATLLLGVFTNPWIKQKEKGRGIAVGLALAVLAYIASLCFQILHLPGMTSLRILSVVSSIILISGYGLYCILHPEKAANHLVVEYIKKEGLSMERTMIILFAFGSTLALWQNAFIFVVFFMLLFSFGGIFYFLKSFQFHLNTEHKVSQKILVLATSTLVFSLFMLPSIRGIDLPLRIAMVWSAYFIGSFALGIYFFFKSSEEYKIAFGGISMAIATLMATILMIKTQVIGNDTGIQILEGVHHPIVYVVLLALFVAFFKKPALRGLLLLTLGLLIFSANFPDI